jgi:hypothetical protein
MRSMVVGAVDGHPPKAAPLNARNPDCATLHPGYKLMPIGHPAASTRSQATPNSPRCRSEAGR